MAAISWEEGRYPREWSGFVGKRRVFSMVEVYGNFHIYPDLAGPVRTTPTYARKDVARMPLRTTLVQAKKYAEQVWAEFLEDVGAEMKEN